MDDTEKLRIRQEIEARAIDYWYEVDIHDGLRAHEYFTTDGVFTSSVKTHSGREAIRSFYAQRKARGSRTSRHVISNFRVVVADRDHASTQWVLSLYAADGAPISEIAARAALAQGTVRNYLSSAAAKLHAENRHTAVRLARERGWL